MKITGFFFELMICSPLFTLDHDLIRNEEIIILMIFTRLRPILFIKNLYINRTVAFLNKLKTKEFLLTSVISSSVKIV